jgi:nucleoside-diphosphate-sugar epimerase
MSATGSLTERECDLLDFARVKQVLNKMQPDYVVHLAAISIVGHGSAEDIYRNNVVGTTNLLDGIIDQCPNIQKVLVASSGNIYGNADRLPIIETASYKPENDYAVSKCAMELAVNVRFSRLPIVITRPFNYTGVGQAEHFLVPKIVKAFKAGQTLIELGNLDVARDFSDVRDLVSAYIRLLESDSYSEAFNICSGQSISLLSIIDSLNELAGYQISVTVNPNFVRTNEIKELYGSDKKLTKLIGRYRKFCFDDTLAWMYTEN